MNIVLVYILTAVLASAAGQVLLKQGMTKVGSVTLSAGHIFEILWRIGTNPHVIIGMIIYVAGTVFWLAALSRVDLSYAYPFASLSYVIMLIASWRLFDENISTMRLVGTLCVVLGVFLISRS